MSGFYIYSGNAPLGSEACGTDNKQIWRDIRSWSGANRRAMKEYRKGWWPNGYTLYHFRDIYDNSTFELIHTCTPQELR